MKARVAVCAAVALGAAALGSFLQRGGAVASGEVERDAIVSMLGGFRGIVAEALWFRAERLQDDGRYTELAQLFRFLVRLDPHTPEVWAYAAWNLAYNISVMMGDDAGRWRWVEAGLRLLRDDGVALNPGNPAIHREIAWLFSMKIGGDTDAASPYYRRRWKELVEAADGNLAALGMDAEQARRIAGEYGLSDWADPQSCAIYWAAVALPSASGQDRIRLLEAIARALVLQANADPARAPAAIRALESLSREEPSRQLDEQIQAMRKRFRAVPQAQ